MPRVEVIKEVVADHYRVRVNELESRRITDAFVKPRHVAMYLTRHLTHKSFPEIGRCFGGRYHTTVMDAVRHVEQRLREDFALADELERIAAAIGKQAKPAAKGQLERLADMLAPMIAKRLANGGLKEPETITFTEPETPIVIEPAPPTDTELLSTIGAVLEANREYQTSLFSAGEKGAARKLSRALKQLGALYDERRPDDG